MSRRRSTRRSRGEEEDLDDDAEEHQPSQSFSKGKKRARVQEPEEPEEEESHGEEEVQGKATSSEHTQGKAGHVVRMALCHARARTAIKKDEISKTILADKSRDFSQVFDEAQLILKEVFGMEMVDLASKETKKTSKKGAASSSAANSASSKQFALRNILDPSKVAQLVNWGQELPQMGLLYLVLALILMSEGVLGEDRLWHFLTEVGVDRKEHPVFGEPENLIGEFVKQGYLTKIKGNNNNTEVVEFRWGPRSKVEFPEEAVIDFIVEIYGSEADNTFVKALKKQAKLPAASSSTTAAPSAAPVEAEPSTSSRRR